MSFTHLHVHSNFSFLDGGSSVQALLDRAKQIGCQSLALTDHNGLYGAVRFYDYAKQIGIKPIIGVELDLETAPCHPERSEGSAFRTPDSSRTLRMTDSVGAGFAIRPRLVLLAKNLNGYSNLCKIVTRAQLAHEKGRAAADLELIEHHRDDLFCLSGCSSGEIPSLLAEGKLEAARVTAQEYIDVFGRDHFLIEMQNHMLPGTALLNSRLHELADELNLRCVATNNVHYAQKEDFKVQDVLTCVRTLTTLDDDHPLRKKNSEYYLKTPSAMANLFRRYAKAVATTDWVARQCNLDLELGAYRFPDFPIPEGETAYSYLCKLCFDALERLYRPITPQVTERLQHELKIIHNLGFPEYFLVVWDIVKFARSRGIRCSGRGSAADSLVAYCLGITIADPIEHNLLFERFLNPERKGMPDIDIDFDAARRDEVIEYIYNRYGEDKVAMVCTVSTLKAKSAIRDLGKAMDFSPDDIDKLASALPHTGGRRIREAMDKLPELRDADLPLTRLEALVDTCEKVDDFPRHLSVHLGGLVIGRGVLTDLVPLEWATKGVIVSQFDKDDIETLGLVKMDILGLRNLSAIEDALASIREHHGIELDIDNIPLDDEPTYDLLRSMDTVGCFQVESPGMRGLLGRLQPRIFEDVIAQISLFRPGPMQADMINPFIARRHGEEDITYLHPSLKPALAETYGVILYQEQVLSVSHALAGFTYGQADSLRRAMTTDRSQTEMEKIKETFIEGARRNGVDSKTAEQVFAGLRAFAAYGFCKAHAASFAKITYQTAYLKAHYPAEFLTGILNNEPMGFYPANVIVEEARHLGIRILPVDINRSQKKFTVEYGGEWRVESGKRGTEAPSPLAGEGRGEGEAYSCSAPAIRIGLSQVKNISDSEIESILAARGSSHSTLNIQHSTFNSFSDFISRTRCDRPTIENLINCGAFDSFGIQPGKLLWLVSEAKGRSKGREQPAHSTFNTMGGDLRIATPKPPSGSPNPEPPAGVSGLHRLSQKPAGRTRTGRDSEIPLQSWGGDSEIATQFGVLRQPVQSRNEPPCHSERSEESRPAAQVSLLNGLDTAALDDQLHSLPDVPEPTLHERVRKDYDILGLSSICHPMVFYRDKLTKARIHSTSRIKDLPNNTIVKVAGVVVVCMRPPTRSGKIVVFITLEDEEGLTDCVVFPKVYEQYGKVIFNNPALIIEGKLQRQGAGLSIIARKVHPLDHQIPDRRHNPNQTLHRPPPPRRAEEFCKERGSMNTNWVVRTG